MTTDDQVLADRKRDNPAQADLSLSQKVSLLSGEGVQNTTALPAAGIPTMVLCDGPYGVRFVDLAAADGTTGWDVPPEPATCFPPGVAVGCSWDPEVAAQIATAIAREARSYGVTVNLGPAMNIKRYPLCGRNFEYYSEDPLLTGTLATAYVSALQAGGVGASPKHFAANNQETDRMLISVEVDERTLREIYLPAFEKVVTEARPATVMAAYNKVNGTYACQHDWLLRQVLREEWGFRGIIVSDWGAVNDRVAALRAGLDLEMPGSRGSGDAHVIESVHNGELPESAVDDSVRRMLELAGLVKTPDEPFDAEAHHQLARRLGAECAVLLKNEHSTLPIQAQSRIAVIGALAAQPRYQGGGSSHLNATRVEALLPAVEQLAAERGQAVAYAEGYRVAGSADPNELRKAALAVAAACDVAVIAAGLPESDESEGYDRTTTDLPKEQVDLIRAVAATAPRTVVVLNHGGIVSLEGWHDEVDAILDGFLLGQAVGGALADLLFGVVNPSGHLAETLPRRLQDTASYLNFPGEQGQVRYGEGVMVGYRYHETAEVPVRYPFGHGLSYTTFETTNLTVDLVGPDTVDVTVSVRNTGSRAGKHVVQVYVATTAGPVRRPARELRAFHKLALDAGESTSVTLRLDRRAFAYYDTRHAGWVVAAGDYHIQVGQSAAEIVAEQTLHLPGDQLRTEVTLDSPVQEWFGHPVLGPAVIELLMARLPATDASSTGQQNADVMRMISSMPFRQFAGFPGVDLPLDTLNDLLIRHQ